MFSRFTVRSLRPSLLIVPMIAGLLLAGCGATPATSGAGAPTSAPAATAAPAPVPTAAPVATAPSSGGVSPASASMNDDAVQTIVNYYRDINARNYQAAYALWAGQGQASGQTLAQFAQGYAQTRQVDLTMGNLMNENIGAGSVYVELPVTIIAATDTSTQVFSGVYSLRASDGTGGPYQGWTIASAKIAPTTAPLNQDTPQLVLQAYYDAINQGHLPAAYVLWSNIGNNSGQTYQQFAQGYAGTASATLTLGQVQENAGAGSAYAQVPVSVTAKMRNGQTQIFCGTYTLRKANIIGAGKLPWRIDSAQIAPSTTACPAA